MYKYLGFYLSLWEQDFLHPPTSGEGGVGTSDARGELSHEHMTPLHIMCDCC